MLYSITKPLSHELINTYVSDYDIYAFYLGDRFEIGKVFNSPLREDKTPSFGILNNSEGALIWNDLANGDRGNAITFVKELLKLDTYKTALQRVYDDLVIKGSRIPESTLKPLTQAKTGLKKDIGVQRQRWTKVDTEYWKQFGISLDTLKLFEVNSIRYYFIDDRVCWMYENTNPMYVYKVYDKMKIYRPYADKAFKWHGNLTKNYVFGYKQLPESGDTIVITKSLKDVMCLYELGYTAIAPCSEGTLLPVKVIEEIKKRFKKIVVLYDNDEAGRKSAKRMNDKYEFEVVEIPEESNEKDLTDYYTRYGSTNTSILLESIIGNAKKEATEA
jgi:hypothetical protein